MDDAKIKEEFENWRDIPRATKNEIAFCEHATNEAEANMMIGFHAGFRTAERLAKIEVLEKLSNYAVSYNEPQIVGTIEAMLSELKAGQ